MLAKFLHAFGRPGGRLKHENHFHTTCNMPRKEYTGLQNLGMRFAGPGGRLNCEKQLPDKPEIAEEAYTTRLQNFGMASPRPGGRLNCKTLKLEAVELPRDVTAEFCKISAWLRRARRPA
jgi:hypothetical protein